MPVSGFEPTQRLAARVVGLTYLLALPPAVFAEFFVRDRLVVAGDLAETARNIVAHERLFRLALASNLSVFALDIVLITSLYVVLKPVSRYLALLATLWGVVETSVLVTTVLADLEVLRILSGAEYPGPDRLHVLAPLALGAHGSAYGIGLVLAGLRSALFCHLWWRSRYVPKALAGFGVLASLLMGACSFAFLIAPELERTIPVTVYGGPIFLFELTMGLWLLVRGIRSPG